MDSIHTAFAISPQAASTYLLKHAPTDTVATTVRHTLTD